MMKCTAWRTALLLTVCWVSPGRAAPPELKSLFPAGGRQGTTVESTAAGKLAATDHVWCSREGITAQIAEDGKKITITVPKDARPGVCWLRAYNDEGASTLRPFIVGTLAEVVESEPNDAVTTAQRLDPSQVVVNGVLSKNGEVDTFGVPLKAGETLVASVTANRTLGSPMDAVLQLLAPDGFVREQNDDDRGPDPQLIYTASADGTYFVRLFAFPATPDSSIRFAGGSGFIYRLTLTTGPFADHAMPLAITRDAPGSVKLVGWNLDESLAQLAVVPDPAAEEQIVSHPLLANTVEVPVISAPSLVEGPAAGEAQPQSIPVPTSLSGRISETGEQDAFRFEAKKGEKVVLGVLGRSIGSPLDPVLRVLGPDGKLVREVDDSDRNRRDPDYTLNAPADGEYRLEIRDLHRRGGFRFFYRLAVEHDAGAFSLESEKESFRATPEKPLEIPIKIDRTGDFTGEIEVSVLGLPEGVTIDAAKSEAKGESAKLVKLSLAAQPDVKWSGPIQIVGRTTDGAEQRATFSIAGLEARGRDLWLTLSGAAESE